MTPDLTSELRKQVTAAEADLRARSERTDLPWAVALRVEYDAAFAAGRTGLSWSEWRDGEVAQGAVAWVLGAVFVRFCEDRGVGTVTFDHFDNVGIRSDRILVDGTTRGASGRPCADGLKYPCPNGPGSLQLDTTKVSDGAHVLRVEAVDSAGNVSGQDRRITVDNSAPPTMLDFAARHGVDGDRARAARRDRGLDPPLRGVRAGHDPADERRPRRAARG